MTPGRNCSKRSKFRPFSGKALIVALLTVPPKVESVVSISGISPVTVTVWVCSPGWTVKSTRIVWPTSTNTPLCSVVRNPLDSARTVYVPGSKLGATYSPAASVVRDRVTPRATSITDTVAPAIAPPVWSKIPPWIVPWLDCEKAETQIRNNTAVAHNAETTFALNCKGFSDPCIDAPPTVCDISKDLKLGRSITHSVTEGQAKLAKAGEGLTSPMEINFCGACFVATKLLATACERFV